MEDVIQMTPASQAALTELDLSKRLRLVMQDRGLTVQEFAQIAGVSKSAMEKYLAGPSSPKATAIASICYRLGVNAQWLLLGVPDDDLLLLRGVIEDALSNLLNELKQSGEISQPFAELSFGTKEWRLFNYELTYERATEAVQLIKKQRELARKEGTLLAFGPVLPIAYDGETGER